MKRAFTLVELLVVVAIIAVLAALVFPALNAARAQAGNAGCLSNLRQLGMGLQNYCTDHDGVLPGPTYNGLYSTYYTPDRTPFLTTPMASYWGAPAITNTPQVCPLLLCPGYKQVMAPSQWPLGFAYCSVFSLSNANGLLVHDGAGNIVCPWGHPGTGVNNNPIRLLTLGTLVNPSKTWAIQDADTTSYTGGSGPGIAVKPVHRNHWNQLYFDWHVASVTKPVNQP